MYRLRNKLGLSQIQLAKKIGASHGSIQNYESNSLPKGEYAIKLAEVFNCSIDWLLTGNDNNYKNPRSAHEDQSPPSEKKIKDDAESLNSNITKVIIEHIDTIKRFKNPERAKKINDDLVEIEDISEELLDSIASHIKSSLNAAKIVKGDSKKTPKDGEDIQDKSTA